MKKNQPSESAESEDQQINQTLRWLIYVLAAVTGLTIFILLISFPDNIDKVIITLLSVGGATLFGGAITGFLFAIPRSGTYRYRPGQENAGSWYDDNTNLEEISDWITKIMVGLTLVQFDKILALLKSAAQNLALSLNADKPCDLPPFYPWAYGIIVFFIASGFAIGYLWTRINFALILTVSRKRLNDIANLEREKEKKLNEIATIEQEKSQLDKEVKNEKEQFVQIANATSVSSLENTQKKDHYSLSAKKSDSNEAKIQKMIAQSLTRPTIHSNDTQKGRWGGKSTNQGKTLYAEVKPHQTLAGLYHVWIGVRSVQPNENIEGPAAIFVDQTFGLKDNYALVYPGSADKDKLKLVAYEAFTIAALFPDGTELELDLQEVHGFPPGFYYR